MPPLRFVIAVPVGAFHPALSATLASLRAQSGDVAAALMDASGDARVAALTDAHLDWLAHVRRGPDGGQSDAIAGAWEAVDGDILGWLNCDDALYPDAIAKVAAVFEARPDVDVVYGQSVILNAEGCAVGLHPAVAPPGDLLRRSCIISQPSCFVRRAAFERAGGLDRDRHYTMDWDLWVRLYDTGARFHYLDEALSLVIWDAETKTARLNGARLKELHSIAARQGEAIVALKTIAGFALHHLTTYSALAPIARPVREALRPRRPESTLALPLVHYDASAATGLRLAGPTLSPEKVQIDGAPAQLRREGAGLLADFERPAPPGRYVTVRIGAGADGARAFRSACWRWPV